MSKKILITGAEGQLGLALQRKLIDKFDIFPTDIITNENLESEYIPRSISTDDDFGVWISMPDILEMDSQYYAEFDAYFINEIFGVEGNNEFIWTAWSFGCCKWELLDIGSNLYYPKEGQTIAWYYQEATKFGKGNPN